MQLLVGQREREEVRARCPSGRRGVCPTGRAAGMWLTLVWKMELLRACGWQCSMGMRSMRSYPTVLALGSGMRPPGRGCATGTAPEVLHLTLTGLWTWDCPQAAHHASHKNLTWNTGLTLALQPCSGWTSGHPAAPATGLNLAARALTVRVRSVLPCHTGLTAALPGALRSVTGATTGCHTGCIMRARPVLPWNTDVHPAPDLGCDPGPALDAYRASGKIFTYGPLLHLLRSGPTR